jgi:hypothetical protein
VHYAKAEARFAALLLTAGCTETITDPMLVNRPLDGKLPTVEPATRSCLTMGGGTQTCVLPGMLLRITESDAYIKGMNSRTMIAAQIDWTIPSAADFAQADLFRLSWLLSVSHSSTGVDPSKCYEAWLKQDQASFRTKFLASLIRTLRLSFHIDGAESNPTATAVKSWMQDLPFAHQSLSRQTLLFELPLLPASTVGAPSECVASLTRQSISYEALDGGSAHQRVNESGILTMNRPSEWYQLKVTKSRAFVDVLVPVFIEGDIGQRFFPIYYSLADVATDLGRRIVQVRRAARLVNGDLRAGVDDDGTVTIEPTALANYVAGAGVLPVSSAMLGEILIAPFATGTRARHIEPG